MNIIEAINSGRRFRRKSYDDGMWCHVTVGTDGCYEVQFVTGCSENAKRFIPFSGDLTADDWEIQEPEVTITRSQFWEAVRFALFDDMARKEIVWQGSQKDLLQKLSENLLGDIAHRLGLDPK